VSGGYGRWQTQTTVEPIYALEGMELWANLLSGVFAGLIAGELSAVTPLAVRGIFWWKLDLCAGTGLHPFQ